MMAAWPMGHRFAKRLRIEWRDLLELVLLPGLAVVLPWALCFRIFRWLSRKPWLYREASEHALSQAAQRGWADKPDAWLAMRKLVTLVDHADYYLVRTRSMGWMKRHCDVSGAWPEPGKPALLCTFHWGAGMWSLPHMAASGLRVHALVATLNSAHFAGRSVLHWYAKARTRIVSRILGCNTLDVTASLRPVLRAYRQGDQVLALLDVPADQVSASQSITLHGMAAQVPRALVRLAVDQSIPLTLFLAGFRATDGRRFLKRMDFGVHPDVDGLFKAIFAELEQAMADNPAAWHFWGESERFFSAASKPVAR